jgi:4'-phosphopantetheinyl transferase
MIKPKDQFFGQYLPVIQTGEIHLYTATTGSSSEFIEQCRLALTNAELERSSYFKFKEAQESYVISQGGLKLLLSSYLNISPQQVKFGRHSKRKPYSLDDPSLFFNISNSGNRVVYAFSRAGEVGIDLELIRPLPDLDELIEKNFSYKEREYINKNDQERLQRFFKFWTVKEAYLKAIGEGMRLTPDNIEFSVENGVYNLISVKGFFEQDEWITGNIFPHNQFMGTLTYLGTKTHISEMMHL